MHAFDRARGARRFAIALACAVTAACGGGGGDGATSIELDTGSMQFEANVHGAIPAAQQVTATFVGDGLAWGTPPGKGGVLPDWLSLTHGEPVVNSGSRSVTFTLHVTGTELAEGSYPFVLRFVTGRGTMQHLSDVRYQDLSITYLVHPVVGAAPGTATEASVSSEPSGAPVVTDEGLVHD